MGKWTGISADEFPDDISGFWHSIADDHPRSRLPKLAIAILSIAVNTATCERLFSELGLIHTARRNRMGPEKARSIQIIRKHIRQRDQHANGKERKMNRIVSADERVIHVTGEMINCRDLSPQQHESLQTPPPRTPQQQEQDAAHDGDDDDPGDGVDGEVAFSLWDEYLDEVCEDPMIAEEIESTVQEAQSAAADAASVESDSDSDSDASQPEHDDIPEPLREPFPSDNDPNFPQEKKLGGLRAYKASLATLFPISEGWRL
jgi:hypothetical protein